MALLYQICKPNVRGNFIGEPVWNVSGDPRWGDPARPGDAGMGPFVGAVVVDYTGLVCLSKQNKMNIALFGWTFSYGWFSPIGEVELAADAAGIVHTGVMLTIGSSTVHDLYLVIGGAFQSTLRSYHRPQNQWFWNDLGVPEYGKEWPCPSA